jgi:GDP-D-mannose dehydratase
VHGIIRRSSSFNTSRINHLFYDQHERAPRYPAIFPFYRALIERANREDQL